MTENSGTDTPRGTATYSPDDNKLRFYPLHRLSAEHYKTIREAGFIWAAKQELFVASMWTPGREDLLLSWCGEIEDEDKSLVERAEERAERFSDYKDKRGIEADHAHAALKQITDGIPFGQPILVGHHSEKRARKDAERIQTGMSKAIKLWETSSYWKARAAGALRHAKYKELPAVRGRRIKGLEAEQRKHEKNKAEAVAFLALWRAAGLTLEQATKLANYSHSSFRFSLVDYPRAAEVSQYEGDMSLWSALDYGIVDERKARDLIIPRYEATIRHADRWLAHLANRLEYERAMQAEAGGLITDKFDIVPGGQVLIGSEWLTVTRVNRSGDKAVSVTTNARYVKVRGVEEVKDYRAPSAEAAAQVKAATKLPPLCNYPQEGAQEMSKADYDRRSKAQMAGTKVIAVTATAGAHRLRHYVKGYHGMLPVFITDMPRKDPPKPVTPPVENTNITVDLPRERVAPGRKPVESPPKDPRAALFSGLRDQLKAGVQIITVPKLFPTPHALADRLVDLAGIAPGHSVLEPSAGTGALLEAIHDKAASADVVAVELNPHLAQYLAKLYADPKDAVNYICRTVLAADFLSLTPVDTGYFDRIVMNPPFENGADIRHILHAVKFLKPDGILAAICANGPRQREQLMSLATQWEDLPEGTFKEQGTSVATAILVIHQRAD